MRADRKTIEELERLLMEFEIEVEQRRKEHNLTDSAAATYLKHSNRFVKWCKGKSIFRNM